jgi:hypothetical protein
MPGFVDAHSHIFGFPANPDGEILSAYEAVKIETSLDDMEHNQVVALQYGITTTGEMAEKMIALNQAGKLYLRTNMYLTYNTACGDLRDDWYRAYPAGHVHSDRLRVGGIKIWADGRSCNVPLLFFSCASCLSRLG